MALDPAALLLATKHHAKKTAPPRARRVSRPRAKAAAGLPCAPVPTSGTRQKTESP